MLEKAFTSEGLEALPVLLHPRSMVRLLTQIAGEPVSTQIQPKRMTHHRGSHNKADEVKVELDATAFNFPIHLIEGTTLTLYYGVVDDARKELDLLPGQNLRFVGTVVEYALDYEGRVATLEAQDLSWLCRRRGYPIRRTVFKTKDKTTKTVDPTPVYSDTLKVAIERLLSIIPEFSDPKTEPPLRVRDASGVTDQTLEKLVGGRAGGAPVAIRPEATIWEGIEYLCGLFGYHVRVELDEIVVRTSEAVFASREPPRCTFFFGGPNANVFPPKFYKKPLANRNGVRVVVMDTEERQIKTAVWPPDSELAAIQEKPAKNPKAPKARSDKQRAPEPLPRDVFELHPGQYSDEGLELRARAIWYERSRQEASGTVATPVWTEEILGLGNGDHIAVSVADDVSRQVAAVGDDAAAVDLLQQIMLVDKDSAIALVKAARQKTVDTWYCQEVTFEHPSERLATVKFINLIDIDRALAL